MEKLNEKYYLETDTYNYILIEKSTVKDEKSKNCGKEVFKNVAYCGNLEQLRNEIIEREIKTDINLLNNIEKIIEMKKIGEKNGKV